jgi:putative hydrolase
MVQELIGGAPVRIELRELRLAAQRLLSKPDARRLAAQLRDNGLVALLAGPGKADILRRLQAAMAVIEGYSEHVMDAIGAELDPGYARLRSVLEAERERRGRLDAIVARLLGLDWKLRQYALGKRFADSVASHAGIEGLNAVWRGPEALPTLAELERPEPWLERVL